MFSDDKNQLLEEVQRLRRRVAELEAKAASAPTEVAWRDDSHLLQALMDHLPDSIYFKDRQSRFLRINRALARRFGLRDPREAIGKTDADFFSDEHAQKALNDERELIAQGRSIMYKEEEETWPDGRVTWVATTKLPLRDDRGNIVGLFGISRDITHHCQEEQALALEATAADAEEPPANGLGVRKALHILLAEDSLVNQKLALGLLERRGHRVTVANNGREAVAACAAQRFDLVLMDVQMPEMDGLQATRAIRQQERQAGGHVPIAAMTAHGMHGDRERCLEAGMDDYLAKPVRAKTLFAVIDKLVQGGPAAEPEPPPPPAAGAAVQWDEALGAVGGDRELLTDLVGAFLHESPLLLAEIEKALLRGDAGELQRHAHSLKGAIRFFGVRETSEAAWQLEEMGRQKNLADAPHLLARLKEGLRALHATLAAGPPPCP